MAAAEESSSDASRVPGVEEGSAERLSDEDTAMLLRELFNSVRYGIKSQVLTLLVRYPELANLTDNQGFSCVHWAAKKGDREMLQILFEAGASLDQPTASESRMMPIHWAASDGRVSSLSFLLERRQDINAQDANGCTPVVIAAQHNQLDCVIYLIKNGADTTLKDTNGDNVLHWGAYKGYIEMVGLLTYLVPHELDCEDTFGQTPLHLAALRGNSDVVEYLIGNCGADTTRRDRNGLNALELSIKKNQLKTEWTIRKLTHSGPLAVFLGLGGKRLAESTIWMYLICGSNERELTVWPWRIVFLSNLSGSIVSFLIAIDDSMADLGLLHLITVILQVIWWLSFSSCLFKSPSFVRDAAAVGVKGAKSSVNSRSYSSDNSNTNSPNSNGSDNSSNNGSGSHTINITGQLVTTGTSNTDNAGSTDITYASVLDSIAIATTDGIHPNLCHSCRVVRPLRSKHCKVQRRCVQRFDHFCPFVGNTLGHDNYKYFICLLCIHVVAGLVWQVTALILYRRVRVSWILTLFMVYSGLWMLLILSLLNYHVFLLTLNLTTNEHINTGKYAYFKDEYDDFDNPFNRGSTFANILDGLFPSTKLFYSRADVIKNRNNGCSAEGCHHCDEGDVEKGEAGRLINS